MLSNSIPLLSKGILFHCERKFINRGTAECFAWIELCRWPLRIVGRIREVHSLEADCISLGIYLAVLALDVAFMAVGSVYLHGGFGGIYLHRDACGEVAQSCYWDSLPILPKGESIAVVIATRDLELRMVSIDALTDWCNLAEVERRIGDAHHLSRHLLLVVIEADAVGVYPKEFVEHAAAEVCGEIEERVVGRIQHRGFRGGSFVVDA